MKFFVPRLVRVDAFVVVVLVVTGITKLLSDLPRTPKRNASCSDAREETDDEEDDITEDREDARCWL